MYNHNLIASYLQLIQEQENTIKALDASNKTLQKRCVNLKDKVSLYKDNAKYWKEKSDRFEEGLLELKHQCMGAYEKKALDTYKQNQG